MTGLAIVFINFEQAARFGHVAWGFSTDEQRQQFYYGSTDHLWRDKWWNIPAWVQYAHLLPELNNDWWGERGSYSEMIRMMHKGHHLRYHEAKVVTVENPDPARAIQLAESKHNNGWSLFTNNCVHQTHAVLNAYGATGLPAPGSSLTNIIPIRWFDLIQGQRLSLNDAGATAFGDR